MAAAGQLPALLATHGRRGWCGWPSRCGPCCKAWFRTARGETPGAGAAHGGWSTTRPSALLCVPRSGGDAAANGASPATSAELRADRLELQREMAIGRPAPKSWCVNTAPVAASLGLSGIAIGDRPWWNSAPDSSDSQSGWGVLPPSWWAIGPALGNAGEAES